LPLPKIKPASRRPSAVPSRFVVLSNLLLVKPCFFDWIQTSYMECSTKV